MAVVQAGKSKTRPGGAGKTLAMYVNKGQFIARRKGRPRGKPKNVLRLFRETWLKATRYLIRYTDPRIQKAARDACEGTQMLWDDFLTMSIAGNCYGTIELDGVKLYPLAVKTRVAEALDAIAPKPGQMLFRTTNGWLKIPEGTVGGILTYQGADQTPTWEV